MAPPVSDEAFWTCRIGPANRNRLPEGADHPLRMAVARAYTALMGNDAVTISSGWGRTDDTSYEAGCADGESSGSADWSGALSDVLPENVPNTPSGVAAYISSLMAGD